MANERKDRPKAAEGSDIWTVRDEHTAHDVQRPREDAADMKEPAGFVGTGPSGSSGGRALHGIAPEDAALRNERLADANRARGAPVSRGDTGGNALDGGQTEPAVPDPSTADEEDAQGER